MPRPLRGNIADLIQTLFVVGVVGDLTDSELLERFTSDRNGESEAAFRVLIARHGPMVWRVCRSVLADSHDAQDAFQATFLVLVRKANGLWVRDSLGPWLHRVALRTAKTARRAASHRRAHERAAAVASIVLHDEPADDVATLLHEEINRLPARFRAPIVLCDLDGLTHEHAARQLGWPLGTVKSRIARGRERLRNRLSRRGFSAPFPVVALPSSTPAGLAGLTTDLALRSLASRTLVSGSTAVLLAQEVLHSMSILRWTQAAAAMLLVSATVVATPSRAQKTGEAQAPKTADKAEKPRADNVPTVTVGPGKVKIQITRQGTVEAANSASVYSNVEGQTTIMSLLPEGTKVKKGDVVARLDESALKDQFTNQRIAENGAEAAYLNAKLTREVAEIALTEYVEGIFKQDLETVQGEVLGAQTAVKRAEAKLERTRRAREQLTRVLPPTKEKMTPSDILADLELDDRLDAAEVALAREKIGVTRAQSKQNVLLKFTKVKVVKELTSAIEKAKQEELSKKAAWELAKSKSAKFERQIAACTLVAPRDGTVIYGSAPASLSPGKSAIEEGATVRERQIVFHIPDQSAMLVRVAVPEDQIAEVKPGRPVQIRVHAFRDLILSGVVDRVAPTAAGLNILSFTVLIKIDKGPSELREGLSASADIEVGEREVGVRVPETAVQNQRVAVKLADGEFQWRSVKTYWADGEFCGIKSGLKVGETIAQDVYKEGFKAAPPEGGFRGFQ